MYNTLDFYFLFYQSQQLIHYWESSKKNVTKIFRFSNFMSRRNTIRLGTDG